MSAPISVMDIIVSSTGSGQYKVAGGNLLLIMFMSILYLKLNTQRSVCTHGDGWVSHLHIKWQRIKYSSRVSGLLLLVSPGPLRSAESPIPLKLNVSKIWAKETSEVKLAVDSHLEKSAGEDSAREGFKLKENREEEVGHSVWHLWKVTSLQRRAPDEGPCEDAPGIGAAGFIHFPAGCGELKFKI